MRLTRKNPLVLRRHRMWVKKRTTRLLPSEIYSCSIIYMWTDFHSGDTNPPDKWFSDVNSGDGRSGPDVHTWKNPQEILRSDTFTTICKSQHGNLNVGVVYVLGFFLLRYLYCSVCFQSSQVTREQHASHQNHVFNQNSVWHILVIVYP